MSNFGHPAVTTSRGTEPGVRLRLQSSDPIKYTILAEDVKMFTKFPLHAVAVKFFRDESFWELIAEVNPIKAPSDWAAGDIVLIPRDWQTLIRSTLAADDIFKRKIY